MTPDQVCRLAVEGEGLRREFKRHVDDGKLVEAIVALLPPHFREAGQEDSD